MHAPLALVAMLVIGVVLDLPWWAIGGVIFAGACVLGYGV